jgi:hypothetical protein
MSVRNWVRSAKIATTRYVFLPFRLFKRCWSMHGIKERIANLRLDSARLPYRQQHQVALSNLTERAAGDFQHRNVFVVAQCVGGALVTFRPNRPARNYSICLVSGSLSPEKACAGSTGFSSVSTNQRHRCRLSSS